MSISVAESLIECSQYDGKDMARRFSEAFFHNPTRGYGGTVKNTFVALQESDYEDIYEPAKCVFGGAGSLGNGAAMRAAPLGMFGHGLPADDLIELVRQSSLITHAHPFGYNGAILQALAVNQALKLTPEEGSTQLSEQKTIEFLDYLIEKMITIEESSPKAAPPSGRQRLNKHHELSNTPFTDSLKKMKEVLSDKSEEGSTFGPDDAAVTFGNSVSAHKSVPTAIYSVLRAHKPISYFETDDLLVRTLFMSVAVGGDTDTIASMACSIFGAFYGEEAIQPILKQRCESNAKMTELADKLYDKVSARHSNLEQASQ